MYVVWDYHNSKKHTIINAAIMLIYSDHIYVYVYIYDI